MEKNFNKGPFSVGEKKIESTWLRIVFKNFRLEYATDGNVIVILQENKNY
jgi:hypothetical protein